MKSKDEIESNLPNFIGTTQYYRHYTGIKYTDGINYLVESADCYWFIDIVASYQRKLNGINFQVWELKVNEDKSAVVTMKEDSDKPNMVTQKVRSTDFPLNKVKVYVQNGVILLPSEY